MRAEITSHTINSGLCFAVAGWTLCVIQRVTYVADPVFLHSRQIDTNDPTSSLRRRWGITARSFPLTFTSYRAVILVFHVCLMAEESDEISEKCSSVMMDSLYVIYASKFNGPPVSRISFFRL
jgi:hypothetical protein